MLPALVGTHGRTSFKGFSVCTGSATPHLTCQVFGTGSEWRTKAEERLCYQALASITACSGAQLPQSPLTGTPGVPALPTLGRKAYVLSVLEHQHSPGGRGETMLEVMVGKRKQTNESNKYDDKNNNKIIDEHTFLHTFY